MIRSREAARNEWLSIVSPRQNSFMNHRRNLVRYVALGALIIIVVVLLWTRS
jgi:hypothetical protein